MMLRLFVASAAHLLTLAYRTFVPARGAGRPSLRRLLLMAGFLPLFTLVQAIHWVGFLLDEILFRGYRRVVIREPFFVLGVPRSGTTHLHRVLADDEHFTTFSTWECLFAPSVTERRFWLGLGRLDASIGRPFGRLLSWLETRAFSAMHEVHSMRLGDPEEDYFALMPVLACFILVLPFPHSALLWNMGTFDRDMPQAERERLLDYYYRCLQKHLYVHGPHKRLLSKNAAFAPLAGSLATRFPDARFLICLREPEQTLPSQLSSIESGIRFFDALSVTPDLRERLTRQLAFYYANLHRVFQRMPEERCVWVTMQTLRSDLLGAIGHIYWQLGFTPSAGFQTRLRRQEERARIYRSSHSYSLEQFGLSRAKIQRELGPLYEAVAARSVQVSAVSPPARRVGESPSDQEPSRSRREPALPC